MHIEFSDFETFFTDTEFEFLKYAYEEPCDVDFGVGASMHAAKDSSDLLGEINDRIARQFESLKCSLLHKFPLQKIKPILPLIYRSEIFFAAQSQTYPIKRICNTCLRCHELHKLFEESSQFVNLRRIYDNLLRKNQVTLSENEIGLDYFKSHPLEFNLSEQYLKADIYTQTASLFYDQIKLTKEDADIPTLFLNYSNCFFEQQNLSKPTNFSTSEYRSIDGTNNNMKHRNWGASHTSYGRFLKAHYDDNIHAVRKSIRGYTLPSPRNIVRKLFLNDEVHLNKFEGRKNIPNMLAVMFAKFIANDVGSQQIVQYADGSNEGIRCCSHFNKNCLPESLKHSACFPITISRSDPIYAPKNVKCMSFVRSSLISNNPYQIEIGEKANVVTSFLDLSTIYGSDYKTMKKIRSFNGGRLKSNLRNVLPIGKGNYFSGDVRVNQTPFLAVWHSIFIRQHNNFADKLAIINRHWNEEKLFNEARKINIAIYQKIIYEEWLPLFLGTKYCERYENIDYNVDVNPKTTNEFAAGSFRHFHAFINSQFDLFDGEMKVKSFNVSDTINRPKLLENFYDEILQGLSKQPMNLLGYSNEILNKLYKNKEDLGLDLLSIDIVRGRDHGIPPYHQFRKMCNMNSDIKIFNDLYPEVTANAITHLRQTYKSVYDIDLLVGGGLESVTSSSNQTEDELGFLGPTFQCTIGEQFYRFKAGDSFFYPHADNFTPNQLNVINSFSMAHVLCENSHLSYVQKKMFSLKRESIDNEALNCEHLPYMNLSLWRDNIDEI